MTAMIRAISMEAVSNSDKGTTRLTNPISTTRVAGRNSPSSSISIASLRGTLRLNGWAKAWDHLFKEIETLSGSDGDARLKLISDELLAQHSYDENEPDRVVLCVSLKAEDASGEAVYHKTYSLDAHGNEHGSAMAQLVSITVALAVQSVMNNEIDTGVSAAPSSLPIVSNWMQEIEKIAQYVEIKNLAK